MAFESVPRIEVPISAAIVLGLYVYISRAAERRSAIEVTVGAGI